jgi:hypothetical protein
MLSRFQTLFPTHPHLISLLDKQSPASLRVETATRIYGWTDQVGILLLLTTIRLEI